MGRAVPRSSFLLWSHDGRAWASFLNRRPAKLKITGHRDRAVLHQRPCCCFSLKVLPMVSAAASGAVYSVGNDTLELCERRVI